MATSSVDPPVRNMLARFRVLELKSVLRDLGCSTNGRKNELYLRVLHQMELQNARVEELIVDVYERRFPKLPRTKSPVKTLNSSPTKRQSISQHVVLPDVRFKSLPFYDVVDTIIKPTSLVSSTPSYNRSSQNYMWLQFHLSPQYLQMISSSKSSKGESRTQVILRLCKQESSCEQDDYFPIQCYVQVNKTACPLPNYHPQMSMRTDYKRTGRPVNITPYINHSPTQMNVISIAWMTEYMLPTLQYCACVELVQVKSPNQLMQFLRTSRVRSPDVCRALVREKLSVDKDSEISATSLRVSLACPLGKMRMQHPCRSVSCKHLQCFDAKTYLQMNEKNPRWICPVCDKQAPLQDIVIDGLLMQLCQESTHTDIEFSADGSWHPFTRDNGIKFSVVDSVAPSDVVTIGDSPRATGGASSTLIDLTADSDDDEVMEHIPISSHAPSSSSTSSTSSRQSQPEQPQQRRSSREYAHARQLYSPFSSSSSSFDDTRSLSVQVYSSSDTDHDSSSTCTSSSKDMVNEALFPHEMNI